MPEIDHESIHRLQKLALELVTSESPLPFQVPGLSVLIQRADGTEAYFCSGCDALGTPLRRDTLFPIASTTKLATTIAALRLVQNGGIGLDAPLKHYLPNALPARDGIVTPRMLLTHTSGLPLEVDAASYTWSESLSWPAIADACANTPLALAPGERVQYSNIGFALLALIVERICDAPFATALDRLVLQPLEIEAYFGRASLPRDPAAVMDVDSDYLGTSLEPINSPFWRSLALPWAGLVTTIDGLLSLLRVYRGNRPDVLGSKMLAEARRNQTGDLPGGYSPGPPLLGCRSSRPIEWPRCNWGLGIELHGTKTPHWAPRSAAPHSFGQIGQSGCLAWFDPPTGAAWAVMAPRTTDSGWLLRYGMALGNVALRKGKLARLGSDTSDASESSDTSATPDSPASPARADEATTAARLDG